MKMILFLLVLALAKDAVPTRSMEGKLRHFIPLSEENVKYRAMSEQGRRVISTSFRQVAPSFLKLTIESSELSTELELELNDNLYAESATVTTVYEDSYTVEKPVLRAYHGTGLKKNDVRLTLEEPGVWSGFFIHNFEAYSIRNAREFDTDLRSMQKRGDISSLPKMVLYRLADEIIAESANIHCEAEDPSSPHSIHHSIDSNKTAKALVEQSLQRRAAAGPYTANANCPQVSKRLLVSVAADSGYCTSQSGASGAQAKIQSNYNSLQPIYESTVNVKILIDETLLLTTPTTDAWNTATCPTIQSKLYAFSEWRATRSASAGLWMCQTNCYPSGTVGLAWLSQVCQVNSYQQSGTQYVSGAAVSSYLSGATGWLVVAHETGHNFGSSHTSTGIMIASNVVDQFFEQASQDMMCSHLKDVLAGRYYPNCLSEAASSCGDRVLQAGEECDIASPCCTSNCTFSPGSQCVSGTCCNSNTCLFYTPADAMQCASATECATATICDGTGVDCPLPSTNQTVAFNYQNCTNTEGQPALCLNGQCGGSCKGLPPGDELWCLLACEEIGLKTSGSPFFSCQGSECWISCINQNATACADSEYCCDVNYGNPAFALPAGTPCSRGFCDGRGACVNQFLLPNATSTNTTSSNSTVTPLPQVNTTILIFTSAACPNSCSGNGACSGGKCTCLLGYRGLDCSYGPTEIPQEMDARGVSGTVFVDTTDYYVMKSLEVNQYIQINITSLNDLVALVQYRDIPALQDPYNFSSQSAGSILMPMVSNNTNTFFYQLWIENPQSTSDFYVTISGKQLFVGSSYSVEYTVFRNQSQISSIVASLTASFNGTKVFWTLIGVVIGFIVLAALLVFAQLVHKRRQSVLVA